MKDAFSTYHPIVNVLYFALILLFTMCLLHPAALLISLSASLAWSIYLSGRRAVRFLLSAMLPMMLLAALINPAFNHQGGTILAYLPTGNPLTLESILYGLAAAAMLAAVVSWFSCCNRVLTSDKFVYLFGRVIPALSLVLTMALRFVPRLKAQLKVISHGQKCIGRSAADGTPVQRVRHAAHILSILVTWALENAIDTADSMKSRGYGLPGRTAFSIYRFDDRDRAALVWMVGLGLFLSTMWAAGGLSCRYFPTVQIAPADAWSLAGLLAYLLLCTTPLILDRREDRKWNRLRSGI